MATNMFFEKEIVDQGGKSSVHIELGRSSAYSGATTPSGKGEDSIYININGQFVVMDRATAKEFAKAVVDAAHYLTLID